MAAIGLFYVGLVYPLFTDLWHSKWLIEMHNEECEPMFITFFVALVFFCYWPREIPKNTVLLLPSLPGKAWHTRR